MPVIVTTRMAVTRFVKSLAEYPPRQRPATFSVDQALEALYERPVK
jgi:arylsulfatase